MRKSETSLNEILKTRIKKTFAQVISELKDINKSHQFLSDFLTDIEYELFSKRLAIAYWLKKGRSYQNIKDNLKVSSATISSIQSQMKKKGFQLALKNLEAEEWASKWEERIKKFVK